MIVLPTCRYDFGDHIGLPLETVPERFSQPHGSMIGFSGARQIVVRNRQRLRNIDA